MASGLMTLDRKGHITYINKTARNLLGIEISKYNDAIGKHYLDILNFIDGEDFIKKALFTHHSYASDVEALIETWNNKKIPLNLRTTHFLDQNGSSRGLIAIFEDLSKKKAIEEEIKKMDRLATLGQFVAHIVHEVKNPLSGIKTAAELVQERTLGEPRMSKLTNIILDEVERLVKLLKDLLNYARPSKLSVSKENVHAMLDKVLELMSRELSQKNISIIKNFHSEIHEIEADNDKLTSLFMNLILNGIQALDKDGEITITTNCCIYDLNDNYKGIDGIRVIISDNGHGIPDEKIKMITEPFVTTKSDGTGLGLSICQRIVDSHKGLMLFNSTPGKGTSVTVNLPLFQYRTLTSKRSIDHTV
jgi:PAS domain S-box-containing protein